MPQLQPGIYFGKLVEIGTARLSNDARTPYVFVTWEVTHCAENGQWVPIEPVTRESRWWVTERSEPYTMDRLQRLGFNGDLDSPAFDADPHPERDGVRLACRHDVRNGRAYENWDLASDRQDREREPWEAELTRRFKAKYRTRASSRSRPAGVPPTPPQPATPSPAGSKMQDNEASDADEYVEDVPEDQIPF